MDRQLRRIVSSWGDLEVNQLYRLLKGLKICDLGMTLRPANSLAFPGRPVVTLSWTNDRPVLELSCLGLYGVSSPLPHYYITDTLNEDNHCLRRFLDIFNQRIYETYFYAWHHKNPHLFSSTALRGHAMICALSGESLRENDPLSRIAHVFLREERSWVGFQALVALLYPGVSPQVKRRPWSWVKNHQPSRLGATQLCSNTTLGPRLLRQGACVEILLGPLRAEEGKVYLPGQPLGKSLIRWLRHYLGPSFSLLMRFQFTHDSPGLALGWNAFLGRAPSVSEISRMFHADDSSE